MKRIVPIVLMVLVTTAIMAGCVNSGEKAPLSTPHIKGAVDTRDTIVILFFYDPTLGTSQEQLEILNSFKQAHSDSVIILPFDVTNPDSFDAREGYRIKTTPTIVMIDDKGYIVKTFTKITLEELLEEAYQEAR